MIAKDMVVFVVPMYSKIELNSDSNFVIYSALIRAMLKCRPNWQFIITFPDEASGFKYIDDGFGRLPNVTRVPQRISTRKMSNAISYDGVFYDSLLKKIGVDIIWSFLPEITHYLGKAGNSSYEPAALPTTIAHHSYVIHPSLPYPFHTQQHVAGAQILGALMADHNIFHSLHSEQMLMENCERWLNAESVQSVKTNSTQIPLGILDDNFYYKAPQSAVPIIAYNHRLQNYKNWRDTFQVFEELWDEGLRFKVRCMHNTSRNYTNIVQYPFVEIVDCRSRVDYLKALAECDLNVTNSQHETFCIAAVESMAFGQVLVAPNSVTFPQITGKDTNNYPYLFDTVDEQKEILRKLIPNPEMRKVWGLEISKYVIAQYSTGLWAENMANLFEQLTDVHLGTRQSVRDEVLKTLLPHYDGIETLAFFNEVNKIRVDGVQPLGSQSFSNTKQLRMVRELGGYVKMVAGRQLVFPPKTPNG